MASIGKDIAHDSARTHVSGESQFLDDLAPLAGELVVGVVGSPLAHGRLTRLDVSPALEVPGVACVLTAADVPGHNRFGPSVKDEDLLVPVGGEAMFFGQPVAIIAAESREALEEARGKVVVEMDALPTCFTIDEALAADAFLCEPRLMERGDLAAGFDAADHTLEGTLDIGGQEQFYLESQIAVVVPGEGGQIAVHSSTQHPSEVQMMVAEVLGVPFNHVVCTCRRMGGAFGGKETQAAPPAMFAALVAHKTRRPARFAYTKDDDMRFTGKRHPFKSFYKVGFTDDGRITALDVKLFSNGGCSTDLSMAVLERAMLHTDNAYFLPAVRIEGRVCRTNLPSNTAFRGFGGPQGVASTEHVIQEIAAALGMDSLDVRRANLYGINDGRDVTHYGQLVRNNVLPELFDTLRSECDYDARRRAIREFNDESKTLLRGMALSPVKFGISFTRRAMNQANALVNVYEDGSALVSTGATEMGQGVNTRIRQIVADELGCGYDRVLIGPTATDKNNNTSPTAASSGTDLNGAAAVAACRPIRERLAVVAADLLADAHSGLTAEPADVRFEEGFAFDVRRPDRRIKFADVTCAAYEKRVSLGERGHYATPGVDFNRETGRGNPFLYFTNGVACSEIEIDRFTGDMRVTRVDLIMDVGVSLNPGIDRGQVIGGFVQGMGWCSGEELVYNDRGQLLSYSPTTYKIPAITDVPTDLNVRFLDNPHNAVSLYRSKAVGEPPLLLGLSVWLAAKDALASRFNGPPPRTLRLPATGEQLLLCLSASPTPAAPACGASRSLAAV